MNEVYEPEIVVLYCGNAMNGGNYLPEGARKDAGFKARFVMMPCSSKIETGYLVKLIEQGADGVEVVACPGKKCRFIAGSARAEGRIDFARTLLEETGMSAERLGVRRRNGLDAEEIMNIAEERAGAVRPLGRNPMKRAR